MKKKEKTPLFTEEEEKMIEEFLEENSDLMDNLAKLEELEKQQKKFDNES